MQANVILSAAKPPCSARTRTDPRQKKNTVILSEPSEFVAPAFGATINSDASRMDLHFCPARGNFFRKATCNLSPGTWLLPATGHRLPAALRRPRMITRRDFLDTLATALASSRRLQHRQKLRPDPRRQRPPQLRHHRPQRPRLRPSLRLQANRATARLAAVCDVESNILAKFAAAAHQAPRLQPETAQDFRRLLERKDIDAIYHRHPRPLAHAHGHPRAPGRQARLRRKALQPQPRRRRPARRRATEIRQARPDGHPAALLAPHHRNRAADSRRPHRPRLLRQGLVRQHPQVHRHRQRSPRPLHARLGSLAGPRPAPDSTADNVQPYNWHWFRIWGTGETLNNGTHEVDVCRWALGVDYPNRVTASGGRYAYKDDWQFYDTLVTSFEYDDKILSWEGTQLQRHEDTSTATAAPPSTAPPAPSSSIATATRSTTSTVTKTSEYRVPKQNANLLRRPHRRRLHDRRPLRQLHRRRHAPAKSSMPPSPSATSPSPCSSSPTSPGRSSAVLNLDPTDGKIQHDPEAMKVWSREYQPGWEPKL